MTEPTPIPTREGLSRATAEYSNSSSSSLSSSSRHALPSQDVHACINKLRERGINNPEHWTSSLSPAAIDGACAWFDDQAGRVGTGVLVDELRQGGKPGYRSRRSLVFDHEAEDARMERLRGWLRRHFPEFNGEQLDVAELQAFRIGWRRGNLSIERDSELIRRLVAACDRDSQPERTTA